jgi:hypothetical protein
MGIKLGSMNFTQSAGAVLHNLPCTSFVCIHWFFFGHVFHTLSQPLDPRQAQICKEATTFLITAYPTAPFFYLAGTNSKKYFLSIFFHLLKAADQRKASFSQRRLDRTDPSGSKILGRNCLPLKGKSRHEARIFYNADLFVDDGRSPRAKFF